jgi:hypothetical protein
MKMSGEYQAVYQRGIAIHHRLAAVREHGCHREPTGALKMRSLEVCQSIAVAAFTRYRETRVALLQEAVSTARRLVPGVDRCHQEGACGPEVHNSLRRDLLHLCSMLSAMARKEGGEGGGGDGCRDAHPIFPEVRARIRAGGPSAPPAPCRPGAVPPAP